MTSAVTPSELDKALELNRRLAARYSASVMDELISAGHLTLTKCLSKYDHSKGCSFSTFAASYLRRDHRRVAVDILTGTHIPHDVSDSNERLGDRSRIEIDGMDQNPLELIPVAQDDNRADYEALHAAVARLPTTERTALEAFLYDVGGSNRSALSRAVRKLRHAFRVRTKRKQHSASAGNALILQTVLAKHSAGLTVKELIRLSGLSQASIYNCLASGGFERREKAHWVSTV